MSTRLSQTQLTPACLRVPNWSVDAQGVALERAFVFKNFVEAFAFMTQLALYAERHDHHPEWSNVYNRVHMRLTTHDAQGLTEKDLLFAEATDKLYLRYQGEQE